MNQIDGTLSGSLLLMSVFAAHEGVAEGGLPSAVPVHACAYENCFPGDAMREPEQPPEQYQLIESAHQLVRGVRSTHHDDGVTLLQHIRHSHKLLGMTTTAQMT